MSIGWPENSMDDDGMGQPSRNPNYYGQPSLGSEVIQKILDTLGIREVHFQFEGSSDSGTVSITHLDFKPDCVLPQPSAGSIPPSGWNSDHEDGTASQEVRALAAVRVSLTTSQSLECAITALANDAFGSGWENDEGAYGQVFFLMNEGTLNVEVERTDYEPDHDEDDEDDFEHEQGIQAEDHFGLEPPQGGMKP